MTYLFRAKNLLLHAALPALMLFFGSVSIGLAQSPLLTQQHATPSAEPAKQLSSPQSTGSPDARALYKDLQALRLDASKVYEVHDLFLRRGPISLTLSQGKIAFYAPLRGRVTGAVFEGVGRVTVLPRQPSEKLSLLHFLGVPLLDQGFTRAYLRFTDDSAAEIQRKLGEEGSQPAAGAAFVAPWDAVLTDLNSWHSLRILEDWLDAEPQPYFYAGVSGGPAGVFDVLLDPRREEPVLVGQAHLVNGARYYDVWASLPSSAPGGAAAADFEELSCAVNTTIQPDRSLHGTTDLKVRTLRGGERVLGLQLAPELQIRQITAEDGKPLLFFESGQFGRRRASRSGTGNIFVVLNQRAAQGAELTLHVSYSGTVISDAGNGVLFVGERGSWYASLPGPDRFIPFKLTFHWPHDLTLVATGKQVEDKVEGDTHMGLWVTPEPIAVAGFNLGQYARETVKSASLQVNVFANRGLEPSVVDQMKAHAAESALSSEPTIPPGAYVPQAGSPEVVAVPPPPRPITELVPLARQVLDSIKYMEKWNGPFPFGELDVAQIPGSFGQGWPGLVYLPTLEFLAPEALQQAGVAPRVQQQLAQLVPFHEVAHQWWGNVVGIRSYRDVWILEAMANYMSLLYSDSRKPDAHILDSWLGHFRQQLTAEVPGTNQEEEQTGPLSLGYRLSTAQNPRAYDVVLYGKGTWVIHMLRCMLRDPSAANPDAGFAAVLGDLLRQHRFAPISTDDFRRAVEAHMTPAMDLEGGRSMDWFFDEWVDQVGIPDYHADFQARSVGRQFRITGTLHQNDVPDLFTMPVPIYAATNTGQPVFLGTVAASGSATKFQFLSKFRPVRLLVDPEHTILTQAQ